MKTHKRVPTATLWESPSICGAWPIVTPTTQDWRKVTCKNCLRLKKRK
jgi:Pyruvate/2-oxoacid:ferredoxin oxidoreductase delta subunit